MDHLSTEPCKRPSPLPDSTGDPFLTMAVRAGGPRPHSRPCAARCMGMRRLGRRRSRAEFTDAVIGRGSAAPSLPPISAPTREAALNSSASSHRSEPGRGRDARGGSAPRPRAGPSREARSSPTGWVRWAARCPRAVAARAGSWLRRSRGGAVSLTPVGGGSRRASGRRVEKCFVAGCALTLQRSRPSGARHQTARAPAANVEATARLQAPTQRIPADVKRLHVVSGTRGDCVTDLGGRRRLRGILELGHAAHSSGRWAEDVFLDQL